MQPCLSHRPAPSAATIPNHKLVENSVTAAARNISDGHNNYAYNRMKMYSKVVPHTKDSTHTTGTEAIIIYSRKH